MSDKTVVEVSETEIIYKGVRFVADPNTPNRMSLYLMRENHTTIQVHGQTVEEIVSHAEKLVKENTDANSGVLFLMYNRKEISRRYFYVDATKGILSPRDQSLTDLLHMEDVTPLLTTNLKKDFLDFLNKVT